MAKNETLTGKRLPGPCAPIGDEGGTVWSSTAERKTTSSEIAEGAVTLLGGRGGAVEGKVCRFLVPVSGLVAVVVGRLMESVTGRNTGADSAGRG